MTGLPIERINNIMVLTAIQRLIWSDHWFNNQHGRGIYTLIKALYV